MNPLSLNDAKQMPGSTLTGTDGAKIGKVADVYSTTTRSVRNGRSSTPGCSAAARASCH